jgi:hypothetical protein
MKRARTTLRLVAAGLRAVWNARDMRGRQLWLPWLVALAFVGMILVAITTQPGPTPPPRPPKTGPTVGETVAAGALNVLGWAVTPCSDYVFPAPATSRWRGRLLKARTCPTLSGARHTDLYVETSAGWQSVPWGEP